jgi:hypothetical protein
MITAGSNQTGPRPATAGYRLRHRCREEASETFAAFFHYYELVLLVYCGPAVPLHTQTRTIKVKSNVMLVTVDTKYYTACSREANKITAFIAIFI